MPRKRTPSLAVRMRWKDEDLVTVGDFMSKGIDHCDTPEEAQAFMALLRGVSAHANEDIGYLSGYYGRDDARRIREWFGVVHPVFGNHEPTFAEALLAGATMAAGGEHVVKMAFGDDRPS